MQCIFSTLSIHMIPFMVHGPLKQTTINKPKINKYNSRIFYNCLLFMNHNQYFPRGVFLYFKNHNIFIMVHVQNSSLRHTRATICRCGYKKLCIRANILISIFFKFSFQRTTSTHYRVTLYK